MFQELRHLRENTFTAGTTRGLKTCTGREWWLSASVTQEVTLLWKEAELQRRL